MGSKKDPMRKLWDGISAGVSTRGGCGRINLRSRLEKIDIFAENTRERVEHPKILRR